jgi:glucose-1-phosphate thymidylyltransferase
MVQASEFVRVLESNQSMMIACPEEIAFLQGYIDRAALIAHGNAMKNNDYGRYLLKLANDTA